MKPTSPSAIISESDHIRKDTVTICFGVGVTKAPTAEKSKQHKTVVTLNKVFEEMLNVAWSCLTMCFLISYHVPLCEITAVPSLRHSLRHHNS